MISSDAGGFVTGALAGFCMPVGLPVFPLDSFFGGVVMNSLSNAKHVLDVVRDNYKEMFDVGKRLGDRMTILMGITATGFGLIVKLSDEALAGWSLCLLCLAVAGLLGCFGIAAVALFPKRAEQPGSTDIDFLWQHYVAIADESAIANVLNDACDCLRKRRAACDVLSWWFRLQIVVSALTLLSAAASEMVSAAN